jgi:hypothetical protein
VTCKTVGAPLEGEGVPLETIADCVAWLLIAEDEVIEPPQAVRKRHVKKEKAIK